MSQLTYCIDCGSYERNQTWCDCGNKLVAIPDHKKVTCHNCEKQFHVENGTYYYLFSRWECKECFEEAASDPEIRKALEDAPSWEEIQDEM